MKILRPAVTLLDTWLMMLRADDDCICDLRGGLRMAYSPKQHYFALSRPAKTMPSATEIGVVCRALKGALDIDPLQAVPMATDTRSGVRWQLVEIKLEGLT